MKHFVACLSLFPLVLLSCKDSPKLPPAPAGDFNAKAPSRKDPGKEGSPLGVSAPLRLASSSASAPEAVKLMLWHSYRAKERAALEASAARINARAAGFTIELLAVPFDALPDKISNAIPRGHGPDLFIFAHDRIGDWAKTGLIAPLDAHMTEAIARRFIRPALDAFVQRGSLFGLPLAVKPLALFYNRALVKDPPPSTDRMVQVAKAATDKAKGVFGLVYENGDPFFHAPWMHGFGAKFLTVQNAPALDSPEQAKALAFARALDAEHGVVPKEVSGGLVSNLFNAGKAAMVIQGPWFLGDIESVDFGVAPLPGVSATGMAAATLFTSEGVIVSAKSTKIAAAAKAAEHLTRDEEALERALVGRQPVANANVYDNPKVKTDAILMAFRGQLERAVATPAVPEMRHVWTPLQKALSKVLRGLAKPEDALKAAQREAEASIKMASKR
ncbi:MAG: extracellular solute-binding protein [Deltaproteobacteria bacterium]|nr:extracellular solute-binding protein [Deltaproteobacteria bacterium]